MVLDCRRSGTLRLITLICGRSRAGKSTYSKQYHNVLHLDSYGRPPESYQKILPKIDSNADIIVEGIYDTAELRRQLLQAYQGPGDRICIWLDTPPDVIAERFGRFLPKKHPYPFEPPTYNEGWDLITIIRKEEDNGRK